MVYHSEFNETAAKQVCGMPLLPIKTKHKGPCPTEREESKMDIIDEAVDYYRANVLFRNFEVKGPADRLLCYLTLYISYCLPKVANYDKEGARSALYQCAIENFSIPGEDKFPLNGLIPAPASRADADLVREYLKQVRAELGNRLVDRIYAENPKQASKWWVCYSKRQFLGRKM